MAHYLCNSFQEKFHKVFHILFRLRTFLHLIVCLYKHYTDIHPGQKNHLLLMLQMGRRSHSYSENQHLKNLGSNDNLSNKQVEKLLLLLLFSYDHWTETQKVCKWSHKNLKFLLFTKVCQAWAPKGFSVKFCIGSQVWLEIPEEGWREYWNITIKMKTIVWIH